MAVCMPFCSTGAVSRERSEKRALISVGHGLGYRRSIRPRTIGTFSSGHAAGSDGRGGRAAPESSIHSEPGSATGGNHGSAADADRPTRSPGRESSKRSRRADLIAEYSRLTGGQLLDYEDQKLTVPEIQRYLREPDRNIRENSWRAWQKAKLQLAPKLDALFLRLLGARRKLAEIVDDNFRELIWLKYHRYDYTQRTFTSFTEV